MQMALRASMQPRISVKLRSHLTDKERAKCCKRLLASSPASPSTEKHKDVHVARSSEEAAQYFRRFLFSFSWSQHSSSTWVWQIRHGISVNYTNVKQRHWLRLPNSPNTKIINQSIGHSYCIKNLLTVNRKIPGIVLKEIASTKISAKPRGMTPPKIAYEV